MLYNIAMENNMKTTSINETLYSVFGVKKCTKADFAKIKQLTISQFSLAGVAQVIDFSELKFFPNLESVILKDVTLSDEAMKCLLTDKMKSLSFVRCNFNFVDAKVFSGSSISNLYISGCFGVTTHLNYPQLADLEIHKAVLDKSFAPKARNLDITGCKIDNYDFLKSKHLRKLTLSDAQYRANIKLYDKAPFTIDVMDRNGEFIAMQKGGSR